MAKGTARINARRVTCPTCDARPGDWCTSVYRPEGGDSVHYGRPRKSNHQARSAAARASGKRG